MKSKDRRAAAQACGRGSCRKLPRRTPGAADRRQSLRFGPARSNARRPIRHRNDRAQPSAQKQDARWAKAATLQTALESGTALRLDAQLPLPRHPMVIPHRKLPRLCPPGLSVHVAQEFRRPLVTFFTFTWDMPGERKINCGPKCNWAGGSFFRRTPSQYSIPIRILCGRR